MPSASCLIGLAADIGVCIMSGALVMLSIMCAVAPLDAAIVYGVSTDAVAWVQATGLRDAALGLATFALWMRSPAALTTYVPCVALVAAGDVFITMRHHAGDDEASLLASVPHVFGVVAIGVLWLLLLHKHSASITADERADKDKGA